MKKFFILAILFFNTVILVAQQLPSVSYYMYDYTRTNPGSAGSKDMICASAIMQTAWQGFPGAPEGFFLNVSAPFKLFGAQHGAGLSIYRETLGFYEDIDLKLSYAYRIPVAEGSLGIGFNVGFINKSLTDPKWIYPQGFSYFDELSKMSEEGGKAMAFNFGAGIFYRSENIYFGAAASNIYTQDIEYVGDATSGGGNLVVEKIVPHYYITAGYNFQLSNPAYEIQPSVQMHSDARIVTFDVNGTLMYNKKFWGGVSYRAGSEVVGMAGISIMEGLKIGYAYKFQTTAINKHSSGNHEIMLNYCFKVGIDKTPQKYRSIRYL